MSGKHENQALPEINYEFWQSATSSLRQIIIAHESGETVADYAIIAGDVILVADCAPLATIDRAIEDHTWSLWYETQFDYRQIA